MNRTNMNKQMSYRGGGMNPGLRALKKEAPEVVKRMGYMGGGYMKQKMKMGGKVRYGHGGVVSCPVNGMAKKGKTKGRMV